MSLLPLVPVMLLVVVAVWFIWPIVVDPISRAATRRGLGEADQLAENLFEAWSEQGCSPGTFARSSQS